MALYTYTLITKHGYHVGHAMCITSSCAHTHTRTHTHTFISPVACSLSSCCVILWFQVIHNHSCVVCDCCYLCFFCSFACLFVCFFSACLLSGAPAGSKTGFTTEAVVAAVCLVFRCLYLSISAPFPFLVSSSFPVRFSSISS